MITNKEVEKLENSSAKLTITVAKDAGKKEYDELLDKYAKSARIKGFRQGKVPPAVLEKKFGESIRSEATMNLIENSLKQIFDEIEERPLQFSPPELQGDPELDFERDFTFSVVYDIFPAIDLGAYTGLEIEEPVVTVGKEDIDRELASIRDQNSIVQDKAEGTVENENIVTIDYEELDDAGNTIEGTTRQDFVFTVGSGYNLYKLDEDIVGLAKDEEKVIDKEYPEDFEVSDLAGKKKKIKVKVTAIKEKKLPELDDELAQDVNEKYKTLEDLKKDLKNRMKEAADSRIRQKNTRALLDLILESSKIELPKSMIAAELESSWRGFVSQSRMQEEQLTQILSLQGRTKEAVMEEWRPETERNIKSRLLMNAIIEKEKIEVPDEDLEEEIKKEAEKSDTPIEEIRESLEKNGGAEYVKSDIRDRKLVDMLLAGATIKKGKKAKFLDLVQDNQ